MHIVISQPMFFPWVGMYEQIKLADVFVTYDDVQFSKGSFTNRVQIKTPEGIRWLTVPLRRFQLGTEIRDIMVNDDKNWRATHIATLTRSYKDSPFFSDMLELVHSIYESKSQFLIDFCMSSIEEVNRYFGLDRGLQQVNASDLKVYGSSSQRVLEIVKHLDGKRYITGHGASKYLDHRIFEEAGVNVHYMNYLKSEYSQLHGAFTPFVSVLDLIANVGPKGLHYIHSGTIGWKEFTCDESFGAS